MTWAQEYRLAWIRNDALAVYGFLNRGHLMRKFRISRPQASADLAQFVRRYPQTIRYNVHQKRYEATQK